MFSFKSIAIVFPILMGTLLTGWGAAKLREANIVPAERWEAPYGLLVFSSERLDRVDIHVGANLGKYPLEHNRVAAGVELSFGWDWGGAKDPEVTLPDEVVVGVQFPFKVANYEDFELSLKESEQAIHVVDKKVVVTEGEGGVASSVFYVRFNPLQERDWQHYSLNIGFDWEGCIRRAGFSTFTIALPITLGLEPGHGFYPYEQVANVGYVYFANRLEYSVGIEFPCELEIKQSFPPTETIVTEWGGTDMVAFWEPQIYAGKKRVAEKSLQMVMVEFEATKLSETRDRLLFDSGLYMGIGVGLLIGGIHEALKVKGAMRKKKEK
ncbi:MAG: hypothetical protein ACLFU9_02635 [Candidatus Bathyarchaeia archaeon]